MCKLGISHKWPRILFLLLLPVILDVVVDDLLFCFLFSHYTHTHTPKKTLGGGVGVRHVDTVSIQSKRGGNIKRN